MSDNLNKRSTSFAKTVDGLAHEESALDRARALKAEFDRAKNAHEHSPEKEKTRQTQETASLSHAPSPEPHLRPEGSQIRRAVDRQIDKEKQAKAGGRPKAVSDAYKARFNQHKTLNRDHDRDKD